jgi:tRNA dimethylallyltransferase
VDPARKILVVVAGPTASGKTDLAIRLARHFHTAILSADSRQFYREMSVGTAKPSKAEREAAKHYFIDSLSVKDAFSVGDFEMQALATLHRLFEHQDIAILAGGSGLYLDVVCRGMDNLPKTDPQLRETLNAELSEKGLPLLLHELQTADPEYYSQVDKQNPHRVIRALEVWRSTGRKFSDLRKGGLTERPFHCIWVGLDLPRAELYNRINNRVDRMITDGLVEEARSLTHLRHLNALNTVGYSELFDYFDGHKTLEEAIDAIKQNTRRFAKRQLTWFRKNPAITWFGPEEYDQILAYILKMLSLGGRSTKIQG